MRVLCWFLAWEWINIAIEYTATAWVRLPRWFLAVVAVNLATHPIFMIALNVSERSMLFVLACEVSIFFVEALLLMAEYGFRCWRLLLGASLFMNGASYFTGLLMELVFG